MTSGVFECFCGVWFDICKNYVFFFCARLICRQREWKLRTLSSNIPYCFLIWSSCRILCVLFFSGGVGGRNCQQPTASECMMTDYNDNKCKKYLRPYGIYNLLVLFKRCKTLDCTTRVPLQKILWLEVQYL